MMAGKSPKDQFKKISVCGGCTILGELPPEDPVCDSGIFCYGKTPVFVYEYWTIFRFHTDNKMFS